MAGCAAHRRSRSAASDAGAARAPLLHRVRSVVVLDLDFRFSDPHDVAGIALF